MLAVACWPALPSLQENKLCLRQSGCDRAAYKNSPVCLFHSWTLLWERKAINSYLSAPLTTCDRRGVSCSFVLSFMTYCVFSSDFPTRVVRAENKTSVCFPATTINRCQVRWNTSTLLLLNAKQQSPGMFFLFLNSQDPFGVAVGGTLGHFLCTGLAVIGGRMIAQKISVRTGETGGCNRSSKCTTVIICCGNATSLKHSITFLSWRSLRRHVEIKCG